MDCRRVSEALEQEIFLHCRFVEYCLWKHIVEFYLESDILSTLKSTYELNNKPRLNNRELELTLYKFQSPSGSLLCAHHLHC